MQVGSVSRQFVSQVSLTLTHLGFKYTLSYFAKNIFAVNYYYVLYVHLSLVKRPKLRTFGYDLSPADEKDFERLIDQFPHFSPDTRKALLARIFFRRAGFRHCYVVRKPDGRLAYMQWLIYPDENDILAERFGRRFYLLQPDQVMLENAFSFPDVRGLGLLPCISSDLLVKAGEQGYKSAVIYIKNGQITSLNEFMRLGFKIRKMVREYKILGFTKRML